MKYLLILMTCLMFFCTNLLDSKKNTVLQVSAGDDITVMKNDTISISGICTSNTDIEIFNWYILKDTLITERLLISQTQKLQYIAPDSTCTLSFIFQAKTVDNVYDEDTVITYVVYDTALSVNAGHDQTVLVDLPVVLSATYTGDNIINSFWKIGANNFVPSSPETTFMAPKRPLLLPCIFKVTTADNREATDTVRINAISLDSLRVVANTGNDTSVTGGSQLTLHGTYEGENITHTYWKIGNTDFTPAPLDTTITLPDTPAIIRCILRVNNTYLEDTDTVKITVLPTIPLSIEIFKDTTIQASSQLKIHGSYTGNVHKTFWKIGSDPYAQFPPETTITVPDTAMSLICIFKVQSLKMIEVADTAIVTVVDTNLVYAHVGNDTIVDINSSIKLIGSYTGNAFGTFWKIGSNDFSPASVETTIIVPSTPLLLPCIFKVSGANSRSDEDTLNVNVVIFDTSNAVASAGRDSIVPVNSSFKLSGSFIGTNVVQTFWNINNAGFVSTSLDTIIRTPSQPAVWMCIFKTVKNNEKTDQDTMYLATVTTTLQADAGDDQNVTYDSTVQLKGTGMDTVNPHNAIVKYEWKYGNGLWVESADGRGSYNPPAIPGSIVCSLRVTALDGQTITDFCIINVFYKAEANAGKDTIAPVNSLVRLNGSYTGVNIVETFWNINNAGFISSSPDTSIQTPSSPAVWMCIFKILTNNQKTDLDTMYLTIVTTTLQANAGDDQNVTADSTVQLKGTGKDTANPSNTIVKYEWKYGNGLWIESINGTGIYNPPNISGSIICSLRVTALDGQTATDFCIINIIPSVADTTENYRKWNYSLEIELNTTFGGAHVSNDVFNFPVLVRLNSGNFKYFSQTLAGGADIRFAKTDGTSLSYEIERWVDNAGDIDTAEIWVKVDTVYGDNSTQKFYMYWGKSSAADSSNSSAVFGVGNNFSAAWHLNEDGDETALDATSANNDGTAHSFTAISDVSGVIGIAREFDGSDDYLQINNNIIEDVLSGGNEKTTLSFWVKADNTDYSKILIWEGHRDGNGCGPQQELHLFFGAVPKEKPIDNYITLYFGDHNDHTGSGDMVHASAAYRDIVNWHYAAVTLDNSNGTSETAILYVDGVPVDTSTGTVEANFKGWNTNTRIGRPGESHRYFDGIMDEVRIANNIRSEHWIKLCYENQKSNQTLVSFGDVDGDTN